MRRVHPLLLLSVLPAILSCTPAGQGRADYELLDLKGPVRQVITRHHQLRYDGAAESLRLGVVAITRFDRGGRLTEEKYYDENDRLTSSATFTRGRDGRLSSRKTWSRSGKLEERVEYQYDRQGRLAGETYFSPDGRESGFYTYEYDALGRLKRRLQQSSSPENENSTAYTLFGYDAGGRRTEELYYVEAAGGLASRLVHTYAADRLSSSAEYTYGTQLASRTFYSHDAAGNPTREAVYWLPEDESGRRYDALSREQDLPSSFLRSLVEYEYSYYEP
jgi:YD repeat-containing protein